MDFVESNQIFILSPANCSGKRAGMLLNATAEFDLARRLRSPGGAPIGEVFSFMSGLYFRGKLAYARKFSRPPSGMEGVMVIAPGEGLIPACTQITVSRLASLADVPVDVNEPRYHASLTRSCTELAASIGVACGVVLLGSIASSKYSTILHRAFGDRLQFPPAFVGRGDMSRGGLMLRCIDQSQELEYAPLEGATRRGPRPPKLEPRR